MNQQKESPDRVTVEAKNVSGGIMPTKTEKVKKNLKLSEWLESLDFPTIKVLVIIVTKRDRHAFIQTSYFEQTLTIPRHVEIDRELLCRIPSVMV